MKRRFLKKSSRYALGFGGRKMMHSRLSQRRKALDNIRSYNRFKHYRRSKR